MKDSLKTALLKIDQLQHQVDSLKTLNTNKIEVLQSQLEQSNNTVSNLGSLSTAWGTTYAVSAVVVGLLTIVLAIATFVVPRWLKKKSKKAIRKIKKDFDSKILELQTAYGTDLLSLKSEFEDASKKLKVFNEEKIEKLESNFWSHVASTAQADNDFVFAFQFYFIAAIGHERTGKDSINTTRANLKAASECFSKMFYNQLDGVNKVLKKFSIQGTIQNYIRFFEECPNAEHYTQYINEIKVHLENISKSQEN